MKIKLVILYLFVLNCNAQSLKDNKNFILSFEDNFNIFSTSNWTARNNVRGPGEIKTPPAVGGSYTYCYLTSAAKNLSISTDNLNNGFLNLKSHVETNPNCSDCVSSGGEIISNQLFYPDNFFEVSYLLPLNCNRVTSAFWLYEGSDGGGDICGTNTCINYREIDFLEYVGRADASSSNIHYCNNDIPSCRKTLNQNNGGLGYIIPNTFNQFHLTLGRLSNTYIYHYLDNVLIQKKAKPSIHFNNGMRMWLSLYGDYAYDPQPIAITAFNNPATFLIDYVRVYSLTKSCNDNIIQISNFDTFTWGLKKSYTLSNTTTIPAGIKINLMATDYIQFDPGFEVPLGTELEAWMLECD